MNMRWVEFTGMDDLPIMIAVAHVVKVRTASVEKNAKTEIETICGPFYVQEDYKMVRQVLGQYS